VVQTDGRAIAHSACCRAVKTGRKRGTTLRVYALFAYEVVNIFLWKLIARTGSRLIYASMGSTVCDIPRLLRASNASLLIRHQHHIVRDRLFNVY